jgi:hypothetical protein
MNTKTLTSIITDFEYSRNRFLKDVSTHLPVAEAVRFFLGETILSMPSFTREVKPSAPWRRFVACQRTL